MKKLFCIFSLTTILILAGCSSKQAELIGFYQNEINNGHVIQISFQKDTKEFVQYIANREVNKGTYEELENNIYKLKGNIKDFEITLNKDNSFEIVINKLNDGKSISLKNIDSVPAYFKTEFDDVEEYKALLEY